MYGSSSFWATSKPCRCCRTASMQDLEVLANQRVLLGAETPLQFLLHPVEALLRARRKTRAGDR